MDCDTLRDDQWNRVKDLVPTGRKGKRGPRADNRQFLDALLWLARFGGRWRDLPERFGDYRPMMRRYYRWIEMGFLADMLAILAREPDLRWLAGEAAVQRILRASGWRGAAPVHVVNSGWVRGGADVDARSSLRPLASRGGAPAPGVPPAFRREISKRA